MPKLFVLAGPNGAGKSTNAALIIPTPCFDYDAIFWQYYNADPLDYEFKELFVRNKVESLLKKSIDNAILLKQDFAYETNFHDPNVMFWPDYFRKNGYTIHLRFIALQNTDICERRVQLRVEIGGHEVYPNDIKLRFIGGLKNLNNCFHKFDSFFLMNNTDGEFWAYCVLKKNPEGKVIVIHFLDFLDWMKKDFFKIFMFVEKNKNL